MSSELNNSLHEIIKDKLTLFVLADDNLGLIGWSRDEAKFLNYCEKDVLRDTELCALVSDRLNALGRASYQEHITKKIPPDHTRSPQALAFAMRSGELIANELVQIKFDHGENLATFFKDIDSNFTHAVIKLLKEA